MSAVTSLALAAVLVSGLNGRVYAQSSANDSPPVSKLFAAAKTVTAALDEDAVPMTTLTRGRTDAQAHQGNERRASQDMAKAGEIVAEMIEMKAVASRRQEVAIENLTPITRDLVRNTRAMLEHVKEDSGGCHSTPCVNMSQAIEIFQSIWRRVLTRY